MVRVHAQVRWLGSRHCSLRCLAVGKDTTPWVCGFWCSGADLPWQPYSGFKEKRESRHQERILSPLAKVRARSARATSCAHTDNQLQAQKDVSVLCVKLRVRRLGTDRTRSPLNTSTTVSLALLAVINLLICLWAVRSARPALLFLGANQTLAARALYAIDRAGQPKGLSYLPTVIFSESNVATATLIMTISTIILLVFTIFRSKERDISPITFPALPPWFLALVAVHLAYRFFQTKTIMTVAYASEGHRNLDFEFAGLGAMLLGGFLYAVGQKVAARTLTARVAVFIVFLVFIATDFSKGSSGLASGMVAFAGVCYFGLERKRGTLQIAMLVLGIGITAFVVRNVRASLHQDGALAFENALSSLVDDDGAREAPATDAVDSGLNGLQYASHLLECITLVDSGHSRQWRSMVNPFVYSFMPSFLLDPLGLERPLDAPWELAEYFIHGGGLFVLGDFYWNGGIPCLIIMWTLLCFFAYLCDVNFSKSAFWFAVSCQFSSTLLMGTGYGFAYVFRGFFNGLLLAGVIRFGQSMAQRNRNRRAQITNSGTATTPAIGP